MELNIDKRKKEINVLYKLDLSYWDLCFWQNIGCQFNDIKQIKADISKMATKMLDELTSKTRDDFLIKVQNNTELDRMLLHLGKYDSGMLTKRKLSTKLTDDIFNQYSEIVTLMKEIKYPDTFKCLLLKDVLNKIIDVKYVQGEKYIKERKRINNYSVGALLNMNMEVAAYIYNKIEEKSGKNQSFARIYMEALEKSLMIAGVEVCDMNDVFVCKKGKWVYFASRVQNPENFARNVKKLKELVSVTTWCTRGMAEIHLENGEYYVFVDWENRPHLAVYLGGGEIFEVRGVMNEAQEIEENYRDVALDFLEVLRGMRNADLWMQKEQRNARLINYTQKINENRLTKADFSEMVQDILMREYGLHTDSSNSIYNDLIVTCSKIKPMFAEYFGFNEDEIYFGNLKIVEEKSPYKMVVGNVKLGMEVKNFAGLYVVLGSFDVSCCETWSINDLKFISRDLWLSYSACSFMPDLEYVGDNLRAYISKIKSLPKLKTVNGSANFVFSDIENLDNLEEVGESLLMKNCKVESLPKLKKVGNSLNLTGTDVEILPNLTELGDCLICEEGKTILLPSLFFKEDDVFITNKIG